MIQFEHVSKSYGKTPVLKDLNFTIPDGQFVVLIGPSGCGKTTTMKMINRLLEPDSGTIRIDGQGYPLPGQGGAAAAYRLCDPADRPVPQHDRGPEHLRGAQAAEVRQGPVR